MFKESKYKLVATPSNYYYDKYILFLVVNKGQYYTGELLDNEDKVSICFADSIDPDMEQEKKTNYYIKTSRVYKAKIEYEGEEAYFSFKGVKYYLGSFFKLNIFNPWYAPGEYRDILLEYEKKVKK